MAIAMVQLSYAWFQTQVHRDCSPYTLIVDKVLDDGVQDTLSQNMVPWHIGYFKLKEFEKWQEGTFDCLLLPGGLPPKKSNILISADEETQLRGI